MMKVRKMLALLMVFALALSVAGCGQPASNGGGGEAPPAEEGFELALITDIGTIDDKSFNQGAW